MLTDKEKDKMFSDVFRFVEIDELHFDNMKQMCQNTMYMVDDALGEGNEGEFVTKSIIYDVLVHGMRNAYMMGFSEGWDKAMMEE